MSKPLTIEAIEASACEVFCREGFDRASLRDIADQAGVSLSSIHEYFDSKADLYVQVGKRLNQRFEAQRRQVLEDFRRSGEPLDLRKVIHCLIDPVLLENLDGTQRYWTPSRLRTWYDTTSYLKDHPDFKNLLRATTEAWVAQICEVCPGLDQKRGRFAYSMIAASTFTWEFTNRYMSQTLEMGRMFSHTQECDLMVEFICAGITALVDRGAANGD